ncbi:MAG: hypothetical protein ACRDG3_05850, partial [Tepidiformaceae bacterium]
DDLPDLEAALAAYAVDDFAMANTVEPETVTVLAAWPAPSPAGGSLLKMQDTLGGGAVYAVAPSTGIARQTSAAPSAGPPPAIASLELAMRQQLAQKLGEDVGAISILSYRPRTWPNGCAGLAQPGTVCAQVVTPGFEALLSDSRGRQFAFRGAGEHFGIVAP